MCRVGVHADIGLGDCGLRGQCRHAGTARYLDNGCLVLSSDRSRPRALNDGVDVGSLLIRIEACRRSSDCEGRSEDSIEEVSVQEHGHAKLLEKVHGKVHQEVLLRQDW